MRSARLRRRWPARWRRGSTRGSGAMRVRVDRLDERMTVAEAQRESRVAAQDEMMSRDISHELNSREHIVEGAQSRWSVSASRHRARATSRASASMTGCVTQRSCACRLLVAPTGAGPRDGHEQVRRPDGGGSRAGARRRAVPLELPASARRARVRAPSKRPEGAHGHDVARRKGGRQTVAWGATHELGVAAVTNGARSRSEPTVTEADHPPPPATRAASMATKVGSGSERSWPSDVAAVPVAKGGAPAPIPGVCSVVCPTVVPVGVAAGKSADRRLAVRTPETTDLPLRAPV